ncbi:hypothetical protein ORI89_18995 [Sphingobacterium sp. UT-1RO-CII-1]|uniref:hypothetical protein n=1 Tax=Sphingobacterium sp. UT-1RO-CII-1 TaxID=2995225 RepID=UPI00227AF8FB|nr:hypothetical protein [Sphingobacterium sp. UT-1RO-CII-1]MCY4781741.1 hypothetical protein [Sphingobacterium sp. UT-1RO-CII-1]
MEILEILKDYGLPVATGLAGWWAGRPREKADIDSTNIDSAKKVLEMSEDIAERLQAQLVKSDEVIEALKEKFKIELEQGNTCRKALKKVQEELSEWKSIAERQNIELEALRTEIRELRKIIEEHEKANSSTRNMHAN